MNEHGCAPIKLYLWALKFRFHVSWNTTCFFFLSAQCGVWDFSFPSRGLNQSSQQSELPQGGLPGNSQCYFSFNLFQPWKKKCKNQELSCIAGRQNGIVALEDSLVVFYKTERILTTWPSHHASLYLPKKLITSVHTKTCRQIFIAALLIIIPTGSNHDALQ